MPYKNEYATQSGNQFFMNSDAFKEMLKKTQSEDFIRKYERIDQIHIENIPPLDLKNLKYCFVIDGSKKDLFLNEKQQFKITLFNINQCVIDLKKYVDYSLKEFPLPQEYHEIKKDYVLNLDLFLDTPYVEDETHKNDFFRKDLYEKLLNWDNDITDLFSHEKTHKETILETYMALLKNVSDIKNIPHPCPVCKSKNKTFSLLQFKDKEQNGKGYCYKQVINCQCDINPRSLYITDLLGLAEQLQNEAAQEALATQCMLIFEKLICMNLIRVLYQNKEKEILKKSVFILDGTLSIMSYACWLSQAIHKEIIKIKKDDDILLLGIEKTGNFVEHLKVVNNYFNNPTHTPLKNGTICFLNDDYIKKYITMYDNQNLYGYKTYFGKKMFYKNHHQTLFVVNIAFDSEEDKTSFYNERNTIEYKNGVKRLENIIMLLEHFNSQLYENGLSLISMANEGAALSNNYISNKIYYNAINK